MEVDKQLPSYPKVDGDNNYAEDAISPGSIMGA
jgi:hypothetical protein